MRASKKDSGENYLGYNLMVMVIFAAAVAAFMYLWKNPEILSRILTQAFN